MKASGLSTPPLANGMSSVARNSRNACDLLHPRLVVHAIDQGRTRAFQRLGGSDIGEDHELLDQPVRLQSFGRDHAIDGAVGFEQNFAFRQIEIERLRARRARV